VPIDHVKLPVSNLDASRAFYGPPSAPFGYRLVWDTEPTLGFGIGEGGEDDEPIAFERRSGPIEPVHVAFTATTEQVDAFTPRRWPLAERTTALPGERPRLPQALPPNFAFGR
jgi:catechol 2,3-dioxygenase-like lactoylglutathione lyase family enzyme